MDENYAPLERVLREAYNQSAKGKGKERHAVDESFYNQKICVMSRWLEDSPCAGPLFQAAKKIFETTRLEPRAAIRELYGAIVYAAAAIILLEEKIPIEVDECSTGYTFLTTFDKCIFKQLCVTSDLPISDWCHNCKKYYGLDNL